MHWLNKTLPPSNKNEGGQEHTHDNLETIIKDIIKQAILIINITHDQT
jgi:hypothetical protein